MNKWKGQYGKAIAAVHHSVATGTDFKDVAKIYGVNPESIRTYACKFGIVLPGIKPHGNYGKVKNAVYMAHEQGLTYSEASEMYGFKVKALHRAAASACLQLKQSKRKPKQQP